MKIYMPCTDQFCEKKMPEIQSEMELSDTASQFAFKFVLIFRFWLASSCCSKAKTVKTKVARKIATKDNFIHYINTLLSYLPGIEKLEKERMDFKTS